MKDATGELSMTAVAVVAIAAIALLFSQVIWPVIQTNIKRSTYCSQAFNCVCQGETNEDGSCKVATCNYCTTSGDGENAEDNCDNTVTCTNK